MTEPRAKPVFMSECKLKIICKACVPGDEQWSYAHLFKPCFKYAERPYGEFVILRQCRNKAVAAGQGSIALSGVSLTSKRQNHHTYGTSHMYLSMVSPFRYFSYR